MRHRLAACALASFIWLSGCQAGLPQRANETKPAHVHPPASRDVPSLEGGPEDGQRVAPPAPTAPANPYEQAFMRGDPSRPLVALTFDDGPDGTFTPQILDVLKTAKVRATFYVIGKRAAMRPDLVKRIVAEGHEVGNHTWNHPQLTKLSPERLRAELTETNRLLQRLTGRKVATFRPPYGDISSEVVAAANAMGYKMVLWDIDSLDWKKDITRDGVLAHVVPNLKRGAIILQHSAGGPGEDLSGTVQTLPAIIAAIKQRGLQPVTVSQLLATGQATPGQW